MSYLEKLALKLMTEQWDQGSSPAGKSEILLFNVFITFLDPAIRIKDINRRIALLVNTGASISRCTALSEKSFRQIIQHNINRIRALLPPSALLPPAMPGSVK